MDNATRLRCLQTMGIESWVLRNPVLNLPVKSTPLTESPHYLAAISTHAPPTESTAPVLAQTNWEILRHEVTNCQQCVLCKTRTQTVFGAGNETADWLFIGEAPGEQEDLQGLPFVGVAGTLLTEMLHALGLKREQVYIANSVKCRPPQNRNPHQDEMNACQGFLNRQIALLHPKIIVAVGRVAAHQLLNTKQSLAQLRGIVHQIQHIPLVVVYHPAYLLRDLPQKQKAWQDLQFALKTYQSLQGH